MMDTHIPTSLTKMHSLFVLRSDFRMNTANELFRKWAWWLRQARMYNYGWVFTC